MIKKIGLGILITIFLISGLASMGSEQAIFNELTDIPDADINGANFDREMVETDEGADTEIESPISTRAIDINLNNIYWEEFTQNRKNGFGRIRDIECADLNKDGLIDIIDGSDYGVYVSLQNSDGTWSSFNTGLPVQSSGINDVYSVETGYINNDSWIDIAYISDNSGGEGPQIYLNNQSLNWEQLTVSEFDPADDSRGMVLADFNHDAILDVAYNGYNPHEILIYLQNPNGTWTEVYHDTSILSMFTNSMGTCDFDSDGDMDVIVGGSTKKLYIVENVLGNGTSWTTTLEEPTSCSGYPLAIASGDLNHNGYQDIVYGVYDNADRNILIYSYNGSGWEENLGNLPYFGEYVDFSIADINFDGDLDIIASGDGGVDVFLGDGNYNWVQINQGLGKASDSNCVVDINNDGVLDIVDGGGVHYVPTYQNYQDAIYETKGLEKLFVKSFSKINSNLPLAKKFSIDYGDLNHDGLLDLLAVRHAGVKDNNVNIYFNNGDGTWTKYGTSVVMTNIVDAKFGDIDNDGELDIIFNSENHGGFSGKHINVILNEGNGVFSGNYINIYTYPSSGRAYNIDLGDFDRDGDLDIIATANSDATSWAKDVWVLRNETGTWDYTKLVTGSTQIYDAKLADVNNDMYLDVLVAGGNGYGAKSYLWNNTSDAWDSPQTMTSSYCTGIDTGDINHDGITEVLTYMKIYSWNASSQGWDNINNLDTCENNIFIDLNFDGLIDIVDIDSTDGFLVWTNKGDNVWAEGVYQCMDADTFDDFTAFDYDWDGTKELFFSSVDVGIRIYEVNIEQDKTEIEFSNPQPTADEWLSSLTVSPSVTISDIQGSGVDGYTIEYAIKKHLDAGFGSWNTYTPVPQDAQEIEVTVSNLIFQEGDDNFIKWRVKDVVGNGYTESAPYQLKIDVTNPYYQNENPPNDSWVNSQSQTLSVQINDDWSGLDAPSIKYKLDTGNGFGEWVSAGETTNGKTLVPSTIAYLSEGINMIYWAAYDNVGHSVKSPVYVIKLDTQPTVFKSPDPEEGEWMTNSSFKCSVNIFDSGINGSGVNSSAIQFRYSTAGLFEYGTWTDATDLYDIEDGQNIGVHVNTTTLNFLEGTNNYVQYQALDKATNGYTPSPDYHILVDTIDVTFVNPLPAPDDWQSSNEVKCYITIEDIDGSGVDGTSAEYWVVKNDPDPENATSNWTKAVTQISAQSVTFDAIVELPQGIYNYVKWRAKDVAGNGFTESGWNQIKVDSTEIQFSSPDPLPDEWRKSTTVGAQIIVTIDTDPNFLDYSNPKSVEYRYSTTGITNYGSWNVLDKYFVVDAKTLLCAGTLTLADGTDNYVQWRAKENVSEEYTLSDHYQVKVDTIPITFANPTPTPNDWQNTQDVECFITIEDIDGSGVDGTSALYKVVEDDPDPDSVSANWTQALTQVNGESVTFSTTIDLPDSINNWIRWAARDVAGNGWTFSTWNQIRVDTTPIQFSSPSPTSEEWQTSTQVNASIVVAIDTDPDFLDYSNPQSLQYRSSTTGVLGFGSWQTVDNYNIIDNTTLQCEAYLSLSDGTDNYVQWRALENVSDGIHVTSYPYQIKVDTTALTYTNPVPTSNTINEVLEITCYITVQDTGSTVDGSSVQYRYSINGSSDSKFTDWNSTVSQPNGQSITFSVTLEFVHGTNNYIQWSAKDVAGIGPVYSSKYQIKVNFIDFDGDGIADKDDYDDDNDGVLDTQDAFPYDASEWLDTDSDGTGDNADTDDDNDGVPDSSDAFPTNPNEYADSDSDGIGDNSDSDDDNDGVPDLQDDFPYNATEWSDTDSDGIGDNSDNDIDGDGYNNTNDAFPTNENEWADLDGDNIGDNSDTDIDGDGYINSNDKFPFDNTEWQDSDNDGTGDNTDTDDDNDGVLDINDAFPTNSAEYADNDKDGIGDNSDSDDDNDGIADLQDKFPYDPTEWADTDNDGTGDNTDPDIDGDGYANANDAFPTNADEWADYDGDGFGDNSDADDDNDGFTDVQDKFPKDPSEWADMDDDGVGDNSDNDIDGDGHNNDEDDFPTDEEEWVDSDGDGIGDNSDPDIDGDGYLNANDWDPNDPSEWLDTDKDDKGNNEDEDDDNDGVPDDSDAFPTNPAEYSDWDGDGIGDNSDSDDDNDGVADMLDKFPNNATEWDDTDGDGIGDNTDDDIDGDGYDNTNDAFPTNPNEWVDSDGDGIGDNSDADKDGDGYPNTNDDFPNDDEEWVDTDNDGIGDNTDPDIDNDGSPNSEDEFDLNPNEYLDNDGDGIGDNSDSDDDNDGVPDLQDKFPYDPDEWGDSDDDGLGNNEDPDDDNDGYNDTADDLPNNPNEWEDTDGDGVGDNTDTDIDGDGYPNNNDAFPENKFEWFDTDSDGIGNNADDDNDDDGFNDTFDEFPNDPDEWYDFDGDGIGDNSDADKDGDGYPNTNDPFPDDPTEWIDTDGDLIGNNQDDDDDGDGYNDTNDEFPTNPNEWKDTDGDGIGDNADVDDDNDGMPDYDDFAPLDKKVQNDPNLIRIAGVEFEIGELVMGIMMGIGAVVIGTFAFTRKKRLYNRYKNRIDNARTVKELNAVNTEIKIDMEREKLTNIQLTMLKEQYDEKYMELRKKELNRRLGKLPTKVEDSIREVIKDKIITEDELSGMSSWLARLRDSKDFDSGKKAKLQGVLRDWIDENVQEDWDAPVKTRKKRR